MNIRNDYGKRGLSTKAATWQSLLVSLSFAKSRIKVTLYPVELFHDSVRGLRGLPQLTKNLSILYELKSLSSAYSTEIKIDKGEGVGYICV